MRVDHLPAYSASRCKHACRLVRQCGMTTPSCVLTFVLSSTEKAGRVALVGYSLLRMGSTRAGVPLSSKMAAVKSYHEVSPSLL